jgi:hypothetical protein
VFVLLATLKAQSKESAKASYSWRVSVSLAYSMSFPERTLANTLVAKDTASTVLTRTVESDVVMVSHCNRNRLPPEEEEEEEEEEGLPSFGPTMLLAVPLLPTMFSPWLTLQHTVDKLQGPPPNSPK